MLAHKKTNYDHFPNLQYFLTSSDLLMQDAYD